MTIRLRSLPALKQAIVDPRKDPLNRFFALLSYHICGLLSDPSVFLFSKKIEMSTNAYVVGLDCPFGGEVSHVNKYAQIKQAPKFIPSLQRSPRSSLNNACSSRIYFAGSRRGARATGAAFQTTDKPDAPLSLV